MCFYIACSAHGNAGQPHPSVSHEQQRPLVQAHVKQVVAAVAMQVPVMKTVMVMTMQVAMTTTTCMRPV